ncbi:MAG: hypothetical protein V5B33_15950 [Candidatus Accumulibacter sp. UW20]
MIPTRLLLLSLVPLTLVACAFGGPRSVTTTADPAEQQVAAGGKSGRQLNFRLASGVYRCELGRNVGIQRPAQPAGALELDWQGKRHTLLRQDSSSGLPRYEDRQNGLLWIDLPWKGILMNVRSGQPLANECKLAQEG